MDKSDLSATAMCTSFNLRKAARAVTQFYDEALKPSGLKSTQFSLLTMAATAGGAPISRLADEMAMDRTTLTRNLKPLADAGLIRIDAGDDRRVRRVVVTADGEHALLRAVPMWRQAQTRMIDRLGDEEWAAFLRQLQTVRRLVRN
ncbi:MAG: MarR family winged helix-turn-helix transcriptional regulator [Alphaproteobacteria bacterium]|nr:MarR family winged helix-turn-helix transcriptional regulator [Alphaproteobacteria bacterium]